VITSSSARISVYDTQFRPSDSIQLNLESKSRVRIFVYHTFFQRQLFSINGYGPLDHPVLIILAKQLTNF